MNRWTRTFRKKKDPERYYKALTRFFEKEIRFNAFLKMKVEHLEDGFAKLRIPFAEGRVIRIGNRVAVSDMIIYQDDPDYHIATGKGVYNIKRVKKP